MGKIVFDRIGPGTDESNACGSPSAKRVFSNWGGDFFKKNLDHRANTNKILEKMGLNANATAAAAGSVVQESILQSSHFGRKRFG
jgi:hypothetical protein